MHAPARNGDAAVAIEVRIRQIHGQQRVIFLTVELSSMGRSLLRNTS